MFNAIVQTSGGLPVFGNLYVMLWSLFNILILVAIIILILWAIRYLRRKNDYRKQSLDKLDEIIFLLKKMVISSQ